MPIHPGNIPPPQLGVDPGLLKQWGDAMRLSPWAVQPGYQGIPFQYPQIPGVPQGLIAPQDIAAKIIPFRGLLDDRGTEGAGGRGLGSRGGGGKTNWRDPAAVEKYAKERGIPPGLLSPVKPRGADVVPGPTGSGWLSRAQLQGMSKEQVQAHMRNMVGQHPLGKKSLAGRSLTPAEEASIKAIQGPLPQGPTRAEMDRIKQITGPRSSDPAAGVPTTAQMARPVKSTPEIQAKLAEARERRAGRKKFEEGLMRAPQSKIPSAKDTAQTSMGVPGRGDPTVWGPHTPGWNNLSIAMKMFLMGKPVKGPM